MLVKKKETVVGTGKQSRDNARQTNSDDFVNKGSGSERTTRLQSSSEDRRTRDRTSNEEKTSWKVLLVEG